MTIQFSLRILATALTALAATQANAANIMPDFAGVPTGWTTDRYEPDSFANVGTYQGRSDVLGIGISASQGSTNRPLGQQGSFYNTQGRQYQLAGGSASSIAADLFVDAGWRDPLSGSVRTDMWGVMSDGSAVTAYPIIGFTNYGGSARYRVYDGDTAAGWVDLAMAVAFDAWTSFEILFTGSSFDYLINDQLVYSDQTINGTTGFSAAIMQAYNFADPTIQDATLVDYTAHWSNQQAVPEPASLALLALGLLGLGTARRRRAD